MTTATRSACQDASLSDVTWMSRTRTRAATPNGPMSDARITASARSAGRREPRPSAVSASPSRCRPRVRIARAGEGQCGRRQRRRGRVLSQHENDAARSTGVLHPRGRTTTGPAWLHRGQRHRHHPRVPRSAARQPAEAPRSCSRYARLVQRRHLAELGAGCSEYGQRDQSAGALAQPHAVVDDRFEAQPLERDGVRGLRRAMPGEPPASRAGCHPVGDQGCGTGANRRGRRACAGPMPSRPGHRSDVGAARDAEHAGRITEVGTSSAQCVADHGGLTHPAVVVDTGATTDHAGDVARRERGDQDCRGRGMPIMSPVRSRSAPASTSSSTTAIRRLTAALRRTTARPPRRYARTRAVLSTRSDPLAVVEVGVDGQVEHADGRADEPRQSVHGSPTGDEGPTMAVVTSAG